MAFAIIVSIQLSYVRSGRVNRFTGAFELAGVDGYGWSRRSFSSGILAYHLIFNASDVYPSADNNRDVAFLVRAIRV